LTFFSKVNTLPEDKGIYIVFRMCACEGKLLCQFCAISLQKQAILLGIPEYISPFIILILLSLFVAVSPCLPM